MKNEIDYSQDTLPPQFASSRRSAGIQPQLCLVIMWHGDRNMIGRFVPFSDDLKRLIRISRFFPEFRDQENTDAIPLSDPHVSRNPVTIEQLNTKEFRITPAESRMTVQVNGVRIRSAVTTSLSDQNGLVTVTLSNYVVLGLCDLPARQIAAAHNSILGISCEINQCRNLIGRFAATDLPVMLMGETGTGKELAATDIHANSERNTGPLVTVNMAAIPQELAVTELFGAKKGAFTGSTRDRRGFFQKAENGTLFCDEIGDTPRLVQPMLLRALEDGCIQILGQDATTKINVRFIAATDRPVDLDAGEYRFSKPLYHRFSAAHIKMPTLRDRKIDIPLLILHFLDENTVSEHFPHTDIDAKQFTDLLAYSWPGNVRELKNAINAIVLGEAPNLIQDARPSSSGRSATRDQYRSPSSVADDELITALNQADWLIKPAAESLSISRTSCYELIKKCPTIRSAEDVPLEEMQLVMAEHPGDLAKWSSVLQVPQEALRKHLRSSRLLD